jgi:ferredoxin/flavodoxin---NADP+ reductase
MPCLKGAGALFKKKLYDHYFVRYSHNKSYIENTEFHGRVNDCVVSTQHHLERVSEIAALAFERHVMSGKIAIVGAGPSGCYAAQALLKLAPALQVDIIDALPVPFGLVRYGVAADHQGTKAVSRQFARVFERQGARFFGNVRIGRDISLNALRDAYDTVVLAAGLSEDRRLGIPGDDLRGVYGSSALTRALNDHPDAAPLPDLGANPVIVGNGNVAIDLLRVLTKTADELNGSDLGDVPTEWLARHSFESVTIVGRSPAGRAKFDPVMVRELGKLADVSIEVTGSHRPDDADEQKRIEALASIDGHVTGRTRIVFRFDLQPLAVEGDTHVTGLRVAGAGGEETIPASSILTAIGFACGGNLDRDALFASGEPDEIGMLADGLFAVGWFRRGPRGTIPDSRSEAQAMATRIVAELAPNPAHPGSAIFGNLTRIVDYSGWQKIDEAELASASPTRCRRKLSTTDALLQAAAGQETTP